MASQGHGFVMQRAGTGPCSPAPMRTCSAPLSCPLSPGGVPGGKGLSSELSGQRTVSMEKFD